MKNDFFFMIFILLSLLLACENTNYRSLTSLSEIPCESTEDCFSGTCQQGICRVILLQCTTNLDCPNGRCVSGSCFENECVDGEKQDCRSMCGLGERLCLGGVWRSCNAPMPQSGECLNQQDPSVDMTTLSSNPNDMLIESQDSDLQQVQEILNCQWNEMSSKLSLSDGSVELGRSKLLFRNQKYLAYFHEINFINFTSVIEDTYLSSIDSSNGIELAQHLQDGQLYDAQIFGQSVITASAEGTQVTLKKFDPIMNTPLSINVTLDGLKNLTLVRLGDDYGVIWMANNNRINIDRLSGDFRRFNTITHLDLPFLSYGLTAINGNSGIVLSYYQSNRGIKEMKIVGLDHQANVMIPSKDLGIGYDPYLTYLNQNYYLFFINQDQKLSLMKLDENLERLRNPVILQAEESHASPHATVMGQHIYYTWQTTGNNSHIWLGEIDQNGEQRMSPIRLTLDSGNGQSKIATDTQQGIAVSWHHRVSDFSSQLFAQKWKVICQ